MDDINVFMPDGVRIYRNRPYGTWVTELQNMLLYYIPYKLEINLQDWALNVCGIIKSTVITTLAYFCIKFMRLHDISKSIQVSFVFVLYELFMSYIIYNSSMEFIIQEGFFRFTFPLLLGVMFIYKLYKFSIFNQGFGFFILFLAFISASSSEIVAGVCLTISVCCILYVVCCIYPKEKCNKILFQQILILAILLFGTFILVSSPEFYGHVKGKMADYTFSISQTFNYIPEFISMFYKRVIYNFYGLYLLFILFLIFQYKKVSNIKLLFPLFIVFSCWIFCFSLIYMGKTHYIPNNFWLIHSDIYSIIGPLLAIAVLISFSNFVQILSKENKQRIKIALLIITLIFVYPMINTTNAVKCMLVNIKNQIYLRDKIRLFYYYRKEVPIFPEFTLTKGLFCFLKFNYIDIETFEINDITQDSKIDIENYNCCEDWYYLLIFKQSREGFYQKPIITDTISAIERFKSLGGSLEEIKRGDIIFSRLEDKDFVLNNKK